MKRIMHFFFWLNEKKKKGLQCGHINLTPCDGNDNTMYITWVLLRLSLKPFFSKHWGQKIPTIKLNYVRWESYTIETNFINNYHQDNPFIFAARDQSKGGTIFVPFSNVDMINWKFSELSSPVWSCGKQINQSVPKINMQIVLK